MIVHCTDSVFHRSHVSHRSCHETPADHARVWVLGVEAGGTRSEALLADWSGRILCHGRCSFDDPEAGRGPGGSGRSDESMRAAVRRALGEPRVSEFPGAERETQRNPGSMRSAVGQPETLYVIGRSRLPEGSLPQSLEGSARYCPVREQDGPLALADTDSGLVVLSGTGAFVYGRRPDGRERMFDALGPLLGDAGSAFDIGLRALRAVGRASWHPRHATSLVEPLMEACAQYAGNGGQFNLVGYMLQHRDRSEIASLARIVDAHAEAGDAVARRVLSEAADAISETLADVVDALDLRRAALPMVAAGSVARRSRVFWARVCERAHSIAPDLSPIVPDLPDVVGIMLAGSRCLYAGGTASSPSAHDDGVSVGFAERLRLEAAELEQDRDRQPQVS